MKLDSTKFNRVAAALAEELKYRGAGGVHELRQKAKRLHQKTRQHQHLVDCADKLLQAQARLGRAPVQILSFDRLVTRASALLRPSEQT